MNKYDILVRGENVHIEFTRVNDSRRIKPYQKSHKNPNLFGVSGAMLCRVDLPAIFGGKWWMEHYPTKTYCPSGVAYCSRKDKWSSLKGRHESLADALSDVDKAIHAEIVGAFTLAEKARTKVKGPAHTPRTAKRKAKAQRPRRIDKVLEELRLLLDMMAPKVIAQTEEKPTRWLCGVDIVHPAGTTAKPDAKEVDPFLYPSIQENA